MIQNRSTFVTTELGRARSASRLDAIDCIRATLADRRWKLAIAVALAAAVRLFVLIRAHGMLDGDEAVLGIQAEDILHGAHPIYFYGQAYMGSWDAYLAAPLIAIFGPSAWVLHALTLAESLLLVPLLGALAARLYSEGARLPAMLLAALPPLYVTMGELRMLGGYVETLVLGTALMLLATSIASRWEERRSTRALWALVGLLVGLALWIDALIVYYLLAVAIWLLPFAAKRLRRGWAERAREWRPILFNALACLATTVVGAAPAVGYGLRNHFVNFGIYGSNQIAAANLGPGSHHAFVTDPLRLPVAAYYFFVALPMNLGALIPWSMFPSGAVLTVVAAITAGGLSLLAVCRTLLVLITPSGRASSRPPLPSGTPLPARWCSALPAMLVLVIFVVYWRSPVTSVLLYIKYWTANARYALPLATGMALMFAGLFAGAFGSRQDEPSSRQHVPTPDQMGRRVPLVRLRERAQLFALIVLLASFAVPYLTTDGVDVMQSAYTPSLRFPAESAGLFEYLEHHHIQYAWANHWIGNIVMYEEDEQVLCADYVEIAVIHGVDRFPHVTQLVASASRPSFIIRYDPTKGEPDVATRLDALHVTYTSAHFGPLWVITPLSRTVRPQEILPELEGDA